MSAQNKPALKFMPEIGDAQIALLERLCNACAVSGNENEVRAIILEELQPFAEDTRVDALGNVLVTRKGVGENRLRVMVAAHMDEVGFMLVEEEGPGIFRFETVGGIDPRFALAKPVWVGKHHVPGVIGSPPRHLTSESDRASIQPFENLRIDVGLDEKRVKPGDWATFATSFFRSGPSLFAKALDDRLGVATLIELVRHAPDNIDLLAAFTVQEEVGLRGAKVAAYALDPQVGIALDFTPDHDLPSWEDGAKRVTDNPRYNSHLDGGPALYVADKYTIGAPRLLHHLIQTAEEYAIPYQFRQPGGGGTDAGAIHTQRAGIPSISISVPGRYIHTPISYVRLADWQHTLRLVYSALERITPDVLTPRM